MPERSLSWILAHAQCNKVKFSELLPIAAVAADFASTNAPKSTAQEEREFLVQLEYQLRHSSRPRGTGE